MGNLDHYRGQLLFFCGDNLGSQFIGGFKEGSQAHRPCRECMGDKNQIKTHVSMGISFKHYHTLVSVVILKLTCAIIHW